MGWREKVMRQAELTIQENDLEDRTGFVDILRDVAWAMILRLTPMDFGDIHSCYDNDGNIAYAGVDLTEADNNGDLWMSYQTAQNDYAIDPGLTAWLAQLLQDGAVEHGVTWDIPVIGERALLNPHEGFLSAEEICVLCRAFAPHLIPN